MFEGRGATLNSNGFLKFSVQTLEVLEHLGLFIEVQRCDERFKLDSITSGGFRLFELVEAVCTFVLIALVEIDVVEERRETIEVMTKRMIGIFDDTTSICESITTEA